MVHLSNTVAQGSVRSFPGNAVEYLKNEIGKLINKRETNENNHLGQLAQFTYLVLTDRAGDLAVFSLYITLLSTHIHHDTNIIGAKRKCSIVT